MTGRLGLATILATIGLIAVPPIPAGHACGFDGVFDGGFGIAHPLAVTVAVALRRTIDDGRLPESTAGPLEAGAAGLWRTTADIRAFARSLPPPEGGGASPSFVLLLADSDLWTRLTAGPDGFAAQIHVAGAQPGETVLITHGGVLKAVLQGSLTWREALEYGLVTMEVGDEAVAALLSRASASTAGSASTDVGRRLPWRASPIRN